MENLEMRYDMRGNGKTVRFQDYVVVAHGYRDVERRRTCYGFCVYRPMETEDEAGVSFIELRLECIDNLFPASDLGGYERRKAKPSCQHLTTASSYNRVLYKSPGGIFSHRGFLLRHICAEMLEKLLSSVFFIIILHPIRLNHPVFLNRQPVPVQTS